MARRQGHGGHHGGAWKVAYADFVTAMMALFMVLWICSQSEEIVESTAAYFQNPMGAFSAIESPKIVRSGDTEGNSKTTATNDGDAPVSLEYLKSTAAELYQKLNLDPNNKDNPIDIIVTKDGLRILIYDRKSQPLFVSKTPILTEWGTFVMQNVAWIIERYPLYVKISGFAPLGLEMTPDYTPWDLTAERANVTRRTLVSYALDPKKVSCVSGYGSTRCLPELPPDAEKNQRIELNLFLKDTESK